MSRIGCRVGSVMCADFDRNIVGFAEACRLGVPNGEGSRGHRIHPFDEPGLARGRVALTRRPRHANTCVSEPTQVRVD